MCRSGHDLINGLRTNLYGFSLPGPRDPFGTTHRSSASSVRDLASHGSDLRQCTSFADGERLAASAASAPVRATRLPACVSLPLHPSLPPNFFFFQALAIAFLQGFVLTAISARHAWEPEDPLQLASGESEPGRRGIVRLSTAGSFCSSFHSGHSQYCN